MIVWLNPAALVALLAVAGPLLVHLLTRVRAERLPFPSLRFIRPSRLAAVRLQTPSDAMLLALRMGMVALAVIASAQPLVVTAARLDAWNHRVARAVLVDASASMRSLDAAVLELFETEARGLDWAVRVDDPDLRSGLERAAHVLAPAPPARREIVVISDFQSGALSANDVQSVPAGIGVRFVRAGPLPSERRFDGPSFIGEDGTSIVSSITLSGPRTAVTRSAHPSVPDGLTLLGGDPEAVRTILRAVATAGASSPAGAEPLIVRFSDGPLPAAIRRVSPGWQLTTVLRLRTDPEIAEAAALSDASPDLVGDAPWFVIARDRRDQAIVRAAAAGSALVLDVGAAASAYVSAAVLRGALIARAGRTGDPEQEVQQIPTADLDDWSRASAPVSSQDALRAGRSDGRWCWAGVLPLLGIEAGLRRTRRAPKTEVEADAA